MSNTWVRRSDALLVTQTDAADMTKRFGSRVDFHTYTNNAEWLYDPDLSAVARQPVKYWEISGDTVALADQSTRDAIDAAEVGARRDAIAAELDQVQTLMRAFTEIMVDEINLLRAAAVPPLSSRTLSQLKTALRNKLNS